MELFGSQNSPYVRHCRIAMLEAADQLGDAAKNWRFSVVDRSATDQASPTLQVPYLRDGEQLLTDSSPILMHIRTQMGLSFLPELADMKLYFLATTLLDSAINRFMIEKDGLGPEQSPYLARQDQRIQVGLAALEGAQLGPLKGRPSDGQTRIACLLAWGLFRERFSLERHPNLQHFLDSCSAYPHFAATKPG